MSGDLWLYEAHADLEDAYQRVKHKLSEVVVERDALLKEQGKLLAEIAYYRAELAWIS